MRTAICATAALLSLCGASSAEAAVVLDQTTLLPPNGYSGAQVTAYYGSPYQAAQTFTAGLTGLLTKVDLMVGGVTSYPVTLTLRNVTGGLPDAVDANAAGAFTFSAPAGFYSAITSVDVSSAGFQLLAGQQYALALSSASATYGGWADGNAYSGGATFSRTAYNATWVPGGIGSNSDLQFATYVDVAAVPEPATWLLMVVGFGLTGAALRRRSANPQAACVRDFA